MNRKWGIAAIIAVIVAIAIGSTFVFSNSSKGKGEVMELSPLEMKKFMSEDGNGYVMLNSDEKRREDWMLLLKKLAKENDIHVKELYEGREDIPGTSNPHVEFNSKKRDSLAYYQKGKLIKDVKFNKRQSTVEIEKEVDAFIKSIQEKY
jgi:hypothetical protein